MTDPIHGETEPSKCTHRNMSGYEFHSKCDDCGESWGSKPPSYVLAIGHNPEPAAPICGRVPGKTCQHGRLLTEKCDDCEGTYLPDAPAPTRYGYEEESPITERCVEACKTGRHHAFGCPNDMDLVIPAPTEPGSGAESAQLTTLHCDCGREWLIEGKAIGRRTA